MEQESGGKKSNEQLLSEREAIMRQLAMLGSGRGLESILQYFKREIQLKLLQNCFKIQKEANGFISE